MWEMRSSKTPLKPICMLGVTSFYLQSLPAFSLKNFLLWCIANMKTLFGVFSFVIFVTRRASMFNSQNAFQGAYEGTVGKRRGKKAIKLRNGENASIHGSSIKWCS